MGNTNVLHAESELEALGASRTAREREFALHLSGAHAGLTQLFALWNRTEVQAALANGRGFETGFPLSRKRFYPANPQRMADIVYSVRKSGLNIVLSEAGFQAWVVRVSSLGAPLEQMLFLRKLALGNFVREGRDIRLSEEGRISDERLELLQRVAEGEPFEPSLWMPNLEMLRFFAECADDGKREAYLAQALAKHFS